MKKKTKKEEDDDEGEEVAAAELREWTVQIVPSPFLTLPTSF